jgi:ADP-glucose pyrophosphorylase
MAHPHVFAMVLTQYKSHSLDRHIATTWRMSPPLGNYVTPVPAQMRRGPRWFAGSADAKPCYAPARVRGLTRGLAATRRAW